MNKSNTNITERPSKEIIENLLINENYTITKLSSTFGVSRRTISRWISLYNIDYSNAWRFESPKKLTNIQKEVLLGTVLGDSCLFKYNKNGYPSLVCSHSLKQKDYLQLKLDIFRDFVYDKKVKKYNKKTGAKFCFRTSCSKVFYDFYKMFYINNVKVINKNILDMLTPISLAFWFQDDGSRCKNRGLAIHTNSFKYDEVDLICKWFFEKHGIYCSPQRRAKNQYVVFMSNRTTEKFAEIVLPWTHIDLRYKFKGIFFKNPQRPYAVPFKLKELVGTEDMV